MSEWINYRKQKPEKEGEYLVSIIAGNICHQVLWFYAERPEDTWYAHYIWDGPGFYEGWDEPDICPTDYVKVENLAYWMPIPREPLSDLFEEEEE